MSEIWLRVWACVEQDQNSLFANISRQVSTGTPLRAIFKDKSIYSACSSSIIFIQRINSSLLVLKNLIEIVLHKLPVMKDK